MRFKRINLPLILHKRGFYYGHIVLFAGTLGVIMSVPGQTMGVSVYTEHLIEALGISRVQLSMMYMFGTLSSAAILPYAGRLLDTMGSRFLATLACAGLASSLILLSLAPSISTGLAESFGVSRLWTSLLVAYFAFLGIRHFGQGQLTMASRTMMARWFDKRRGLMLGISGTFVAFAFGMAPVFLTWMITEYEWRESLHLLAIVGFAMALFTLAFFRRSPEHCGLAVDGGLIADANTPNTFDALKASFTAAQARRTFIFWVFNLGMVSQAFLVTAITFHMSHIGSLSGRSNLEAFSVFISVSVIATISELLAGYLSDRIPLKYLLAVMQAGLGLGLVGIGNFESEWGFWCAAAGLGVSSGNFSLLSSAAWPKLFGRLHLGAINGIVSAWMVAGSALGPYFFSQGESLAGNYKTVALASAIFPAIIFAASFFVTHPRPKELR